MITKKQYEDALRVINLYVRQLESNCNNINRYNHNTKLCEVQMSIRLCKSLETIATQMIGFENRNDWGQVSLAEIAMASKRDFYVLRNFGHKSMAELEQILLNAGLKFRE